MPQTQINPDLLPCFGQHQDLLGRLAGILGQTPIHQISSNFFEIYGDTATAGVCVKLGQFLGPPENKKDLLRFNLDLHRFDLTVQPLAPENPRGTIILLTETALHLSLGSHIYQFTCSRIRFHNFTTENLEDMIDANIRI